MIAASRKGRRFYGSIGRLVALVLLCIPAGCRRTDDDRIQGYVEGQFVHVASSMAGTLETLHEQRGAWVKAGDLLFELENEPQEAASAEAAGRLAQARATLEDAKKGRRPSEIEAIEAQLQQARAAMALAEKEFSRQEGLFRSGATTAQELDRVRSMYDQYRQRVTQLDAELKTAQLGSRSDQIVALEANVRALEAALAKAEWELSQSRQGAPQAGLVFDTLYREGEWVPAGRAVVMLLPPGNVKVRAFVPETRISTIHTGDEVRVTVDGFAEPVLGRISFISPQAEYTPPVIYSRQTRSKLVYLVEASFDPNVAASLHPGQPVDVQFRL